MPRRLRVHAPFGFYHVTLRGNHQQPVFRRHEHREWLNEIVATAIERHGARAHGYCWMTNHVHLLVQIGQAPLGRVIHSIAGRFARQVQADLATTGHLFENRYHAKLVDTDEYLLALLRYIHLNPVEAKLARRAMDYPWSSHRAYAGVTRVPWVTTDFLLSLLGPTHARSVEAYLDLMDGTAAVTEPTERVSPILHADAAFAAPVPATRAGRCERSLDHVIDDVCKELSVSCAALESRSARRALAHARALVAHRCRRDGIASVAEVARRFGRDESTLREGLRRYCPEE